MRIPPLRDILDPLQHDVLPAAGTAALIVCLAYVLGRAFVGVVSVVGGIGERMRSGYTYFSPRGVAIAQQFVALGVAVAVVVAFLAGNFTLQYLKTGDELAWGEPKTTRLIPWIPENESSPGWHWLPRAGLLLIAVGLVSRWIGLVAGRLLPERLWWGANLLTWAPRIGAVVVAAGWLASGKANEGQSWLMPALAGAMLLSWVVLDGVAYPRTDPETEYDPNSVPDASRGAEVAAYLWLMFFAAGAIMLYAHSGKFMEVALILSSAMFGVAVAAGPLRADASAAVPAGVAFLPGLMLPALVGLGDHEVPKLCFWLVALAPLVLLPFLIPVLGRSNGWFLRVLRLALVLAPLVAAVVLAAQHETIATQDEWE